MWQSSYAGSGEGICLCFSSALPPFETTFRVAYVSPLPTVKFSARGGELVRAFILSKDKSFEWEREWRFVDYNEGCGHKPISPCALRAVVLGPLATTDTSNAIVTLVRALKPHVEVLQAAYDASNSSVRVEKLTETLARPGGTLLLDYLAGVPSEVREPLLDQRIRGMANTLNSCSRATIKRSAKEVVEEAANLIVALHAPPVPPAGPNYGSLAGLLFDLVKELRGAVALQF
jgi:hypothetical protein